MGRFVLRCSDAAKTENKKERAIEIAFIHVFVHKLKKVQGHPFRSK